MGPPLLCSLLHLPCLKNRPLAQKPEGGAGRSRDSAGGGGPGGVFSRGPGCATARALPRGLRGPKGKPGPPSRVSPLTLGGRPPGLRPGWPPPPSFASWGTDLAFLGRVRGIPGTGGSPAPQAAVRRHNQGGPGPPPFPLCPPHLGNNPRGGPSPAFFSVLKGPQKGGHPTNNGGAPPGDSDQFSAPTFSHPRGNFPPPGSPPRWRRRPLFPRRQCRGASTARSATFPEKTPLDLSMNNFREIRVVPPKGVVPSSVPQ